MVNTDKKVSRYVVKQDGTIISQGWTYDLGRRASVYQARFPGCIVKRVGKKVTVQEAEQWEIKAGLGAICLL